ncbi:MAG: hypothetical protein RIQ79_627 [Verrucomicrobiota bacterium]
MSSGYRYVVEQAVAERLLRLSARQIRSLLELFQHLADNPDEAGAQWAIDREGRKNQAVTHGPFTVVYWPDHAVRELRVVAVELT